MTTERGPLNTWEITWKFGHIEQVQGHQLLMDWFASSDFGSMFSSTTTKEKESRLTIHGEFDGQWVLVLSAPQSEVHTVRRITGSETVLTDDQY